MDDRLSLNGVELPKIGLGTGRLRGAEAVRAVLSALESGYRHIDTAAKYGNEEEVGEALRTCGIDRDKVFVTTKIMPASLSASEGFTRPEDSLERLKLDHVDLLMLHWPDQATALEPQLDVLRNAQQRGLTRYIGVCNFPPVWLRQVTGSMGFPVVVNQAERHPYLDDTEVFETCLELGIALVAFSPLGRGALLEEPVVTQIAHELGRKPAQVILRWHMQLPGNAVVPSSSKASRIADNLSVFDFTLSATEMAKIDALSRPGARVVKGPQGYRWNATAKDIVPLR